MVGAAPEITTFPHSRHDCLIHPLQDLNRAQKEKLFCGNCFCFVCDVKVSECKHWSQHCVAVNNAHWQGERQRMQRLKALGNTSGDLCTLCEGSGFSNLLYRRGRCSRCAGTGVLKASLIKMVPGVPTYVTCKCHGGPIPKNMYARVVDNSRIIREKEQNGNEYAIHVPKLDFWYNCQYQSIVIYSLEEMKYLTTVAALPPSVSLTGYRNIPDNGSKWPVGFSLKKNKSVNLMINTPDNISIDGKTLRKDWVMEFHAVPANLKWMRRSVDEYGQSIYYHHSQRSRKFCWHLKITIDIPNNFGT